MDGAGHFRLHGIGPVARSGPEARSPTSLHCRLVRRGSASAARLFLVQGSYPLLAGRFSFLLATHCATPAHARTLARACTDDNRRTNERCDVRSAGVADWITARRGGYGAYAHRCGGPLSSRPLSPRPYNTATPKGPAFSFLNYLGGRQRKEEGSGKLSEGHKCCGKHQLKCDLGTLGGVSVQARRLSWNFDLTARLKPRH